MKEKLNLLLLVFLLLFGCGLWAQTRTITAPILQSDRACPTLAAPLVSLVSAELSPGEALPNNNEFILQLSDPNGSFDNPDAILDLDRLDGPNNGTASTQDLEFVDFPIPTDLQGSDNYRLRIVSSTNPDIISAISEAYPIYYYPDNVDYRLNRGQNVIVCNPPTINKTIEIFIRLGIGEYIPVDPNLYEWKWYKDGNLIPGVKGTSLDITSPGRYRAEVDLGGVGCLPSYNFETTRTMTAEIIEVTDIFVETPAPDFSFCPDEEKRLSASDIDFTRQHQWYKDGVAIEGAVGPEIILPDNDFGGEYYLEVIFSEDCTVPTDSVTVINEGSSITDPLPEFLVLIPQQTINLEVTTDAPVGSPYRWIVDTAPLDTGVLDGPTTSFDASIIANYRIEIDAIDDCNTRLFSETDVLAPSGFSIEIGTDEDVDCEAETIPIKLLNMYGRTSVGLVPLTEEQLVFFDFEWFKDGVSTGETSLSLDISRSDEGGVYQLRADLATGEAVGQGITSNELPIIFLGDIILEADPLILAQGGSVVLTAPFNENFTYEWFEVIGGENVLIENETANTLEVFEEGDYFVRIGTSFCPVDSQIREVRRELAIAEIIPNIVTPNGDGINDNWTLPQEYTNNPEVEVTIYNIRGVVDASTTSYQNDWPLQISRSQGEDPVYYFVITKNSEVIRKGSITVMK